MNAIKDPPNIRRDREGMVIGMYTRLSLIRRTIEGERREEKGTTTVNGQSVRLGTVGTNGAIVILHGGPSVRTMNETCT